MSRYLAQPSEDVGRFGDRRIVHLTKTFSAANAAALDAQINAFLLTLETVNAQPIIKNIDFQVTVAVGNAFHALVWYLLVEQ